MSDEITAFYGLGREADRLSHGSGLLEKLRTLDILRRYLPEPPATILDIGGASGAYALPLAEKGYSVHLVDPVPLHVEQARAASAGQAAKPLASVTLGDARKLAFGGETADAVLLLGPLYHLTERADRVLALREALRCLRPGGVVFAAAISRFASLVDGLMGGMIEDPVFVEILKQDLSTGRHENRGNPNYFTTSFFHRSEGLSSEVSEAGFHDVKLFGVEGPAWISPRLDEYLADAPRRDTLMGLLASIESDPAIISASAHFVCVGWKLP